MGGDVQIAVDGKHPNRGEVSLERQFVDEGVLAIQNFSHTTKRSPERPGQEKSNPKADLF